MWLQKLKMENYNMQDNKIDENIKQKDLVQSEIDRIILIKKTYNKQNRIAKRLIKRKPLTPTQFYKVKDTEDFKKLTQKL